MLTDGLDVVEAAYAEALSHNVHSAGVILNTLAHHREPQPPLTIATPDALKLGREPECEIPNRETSLSVGLTALALCSSLKVRELAPVSTGHLGITMEA